MGRKPALVQNDWAAIQAGLQTGKYDLICGSMAITRERLRSMHFTLPYYVSGAQVFARPGTTSLHGLRIGVTEDSTYARYINDHPAEFPDCTVIRYGSEAEIVAAVNTGKVEAFVSDRIVGGFYVDKGGADVEMFGPLLYQEACGIAARKSDAVLVRKANAALFEIVQDGTYSRLYRRWVGAEPDLSVLLQSWADYQQYIPRDAVSSVPQDEYDKPAFAETISDMLPLFRHGALVTIELSLLAAVIGLVLGTFIGIGGTAKSFLVEKLARGYVTVVRGTPLLVQLFIAYYGVATVVNRAAGSELIGAFGAGLIALVINTAAYNAETIRGGIRSVDRGQWEAAASLGMSRGKALRRVVLPQAFRNSVASLGNNLVVLIKDTSLVGAITLIELTYTARNAVFQSGRPFLPFVVAAVFYLTIITLVDLGMKGWERRMMRSLGGKRAMA
jgi:His/Glu/Gln/Arg/opine family amino acid ABC transporter permease subunit